MTVAQLIEKLKECPSDCEVIFRNDDMWVNGYYFVTDVGLWSDGVEITTDYSKRLDDEEISEIDLTPDICKKCGCETQCSFYKQQKLRGGIFMSCPDFEEKT